MPMIAGGRAAPSSSISSRRNSAVGALPMATTRAVQPIAPQLQRGGAARIADLGRERRHARLGERADDLIFAGSRARVTPCATILASQRIGAPLRSAALAGGDEIGREFDVVGELDHAAGVDHAHGDFLLLAA